LKRIGALLFDLFIATFISLFVIVDPIGSASVFAAVTKGVSSKNAAVIALKGFLIATSILVVFAFLGEHLLHHLGISLAAFRVAGGALLFVTAFQWIMGSKGPDSFAADTVSDKNSLSALAVYPIAIPMLAGPGCMTAVILHATDAPTMSAVSVVACAIIGVQAIALVMMLFSTRLVNLIGHTGSSILARIVGVLLAALAVQFIADGIRSLIGG
jgi:multiple antibiotic resistance protein